MYNLIYIFIIIYYIIGISYYLYYDIKQKKNIKNINIVDNILTENLINDTSL